MLKMVVATHNSGKLREIKQLLEVFPLSLKSSDELGIAEPEETGTTFAANSTLKAEYSAQFVHDYYALADDSGLAVDILGGNPGIYSARWAGANKDFSYASARIYDEIAALGENPQAQKAQFICNLALAKHGEATVCFEGIVRGSLTFPPRGENGFGYDSIFVADGCELTFAEMEASAKHNISHRHHAFTQFKDYFSQLIGFLPPQK